MKIFQQKENLIAEIEMFRGQAKTIGFVPTMGSLHKGHLSLIKLAGKECDIVICSIFINPTQFNDPKDYKLYPKHEESDTKMLIDANCDVLYLPKVDDIYPNGVEKLVYPLNQLGAVLEGKYRPGHFDGVIEVVKRLFDIVNADRAYFGMKDFQQLAVIRWITEHFKLPVKIIGGPIIRNNNGLALSSRNERLSDSQFKSALKLSKSLFYIRDNFRNSSFQTLYSTALSELEKDSNINIEYFELANAHTLQPVSNFDEAQSVGVFLAAKIGEVRLIDNIILF